jgi:hypothetical protein
MIKRLICKLLGHDEYFRPYRIDYIDGESKVIIPTTNKCSRCKAEIHRLILPYEAEFLIRGKAVLEND